MTTTKITNNQPIITAIKNEAKLNLLRSFLNFKCASASKARETFNGYFKDYHKLFLNELESSSENSLEKVVSALLELG